MKPQSFEIVSHPPLTDPAKGNYWLYWMKIGPDEQDPAKHERRASLMRHAPELLHELKAAFKLLLQVLDHQRDGKSLPTQTAVRRVAIDAWNVIDLAEGRKTEGNRVYPLPEDS